jgi:CHAT domain-containing protein/tetratricopeptide (TPR) repeat protein
LKIRIFLNFPFYLIPLILYYSQLLYPNIVESINDKNKGDFYYSQAKVYYVTSKYDSALYFYKNALYYYKIYRNWEGVVLSLNKIAIVHHKEGNFSKSIAYGLESIAINRNKINIDEFFGTSNFFIGTSYYDIGDYKNAFIFLMNSMNHRIRHFGNDHKLVAHVYSELGNTTDALGLIEESLSYYNKALNIYNKYPIKNRKFIIKTRINIDSIDLTKGNFNNFIFKSKQMISQIKGDNKFIYDIPVLYYNIGYAYNKMGLFKKAIDYYKKALREYSLLDNQVTNIAKSYSIIGECYTKLGIYKEAIRYHEKSILEYNKVQRNSLFLGEEFTNLGNIYLKLYKNNKAELFLLKAQEYLQEATGNFLITKADNNVLLSNLSYSKGYKNKSLDFLNKAKSNYENYYGQNSFILSYIENTIAEYYIKLNNFHIANKHISKALFLNTGLSDTSSVNSYLENCKLQSFLIHSLILRNNIRSREYLRTREIENLNKVNSDYYSIISNLRNTKMKIVDYSEIIFSSKYLDMIIENAIFNSVKIIEKSKGINIYTDTFYYFEKNKSNFLLRHLDDNTAINYSKIPSLLKKEEMNFKLDISFYKFKLNEENSKQSPDSARVTYYENLLFDFNRDYEALIDTLENKYPDYYDLKHRNYVASVADVQKELLDDNSALVEYYYSDSAMYAFAITKNDYEVYELGVPKHFKQWLSAFRKAQTDARFLLDSAATANQLYFSSGSALYKHLLQPVLADLDSGITNLIIVPDGELGHINFETLLTDSVGSSSGSYADLPYLLKDYNIQYAYSATVLLSAKRHKRKAPSAFFAGFAPNYANLATTVAGDSSADQMVVELTRSGNYQLPGAISEVENLAALTGGDAFINTAASERAFKQNADRYQVLHLAMHGLVNDRDAMYSKLLFTQTEDTLEDNYLNAAEIFNLDLSADLVVLSACNTGYGQVNRGEGIMSLSRAFKYAGSPSLIMSLWQIPDQPTSAIMNRFYENLMAGQRKDVALRNAKLDFLSANRGNLRSHPFYWAGLIPIGDMQPLAVESWIERNMLLLAGLLLLLIIAVLVSRRMRVTNKT